MPPVCVRIGSGDATSSRLAVTLRVLGGKRPILEDEREGQMTA